MPIGISRKICRESAERMLQLKYCARRILSAVLPTPVGPTSTISVGRSSCLVEALCIGDVEAFEVDIPFIDGFVGEEFVIPWLTRSGRC